MSRKKKLFSMLGYSSGDMLGGGVLQVIQMYYLSFLLYVMGLDPMLAAFVPAIGKIWDGITDPVMGVIVDRTRTKYGSCRPWFLISVIPIFVSYFLLWYSFGITSQWGMFFYFAFAYILFSTAYTIAVVPYEALLPRIVDSYEERTNYSSVRMIFSGVGCVASTWIYERIVAAETLSYANVNDFLILGLVLGAFFAVPMLTTFFGTKEKPRLLAPEAVTVKKIFREYKEVLKNKIYKKYYALALSGAFISAALSAALVIFVYMVYGNIQNFILTFTLVFCVINIKGAFEIAFFVPNVIMMKKYNKHRPYLIDLPLIAVFSVMVLFIGPNSSPWWYLAASVFCGMGSSCLAFVPYTLLPDLSDVDELINGKRREGVSAGLFTMGRKIVGGLSLTLFGIILKVFGLDSESISPETIAPNAIIAVKTMLCVVPIICSVIMIIISRTYNLDAKAHRKIKEAIAIKKQYGFVELPEEDLQLFERITGFKRDELWITKRVDAETENSVLEM